MAFIRAVLFYLTIFSGMIILGTPYIIYKGTFCRRKNEITNVCSFYFKKEQKTFPRTRDLSAWQTT